jgi:hypothetical protein
LYQTTIMLSAARNVTILPESHSVSTIQRHGLAKAIQASQKDGTVEWRNVNSVLLIGSFVAQVRDRRSSLSEATDQRMTAMKFSAPAVSAEPRDHPQTACLTSGQTPLRAPSDWATRIGDTHVLGEFA